MKISSLIYIIHYYFADPKSDPLLFFFNFLFFFDSEL